MVVTMAKLKVLLPVLVLVICLTYSTHARDTPSTFKKMLMRAAANKAQIADQLVRERRHSDSRFAPRPKFRTALQMRTLNNDAYGHVIEKRSHMSNHADQAKHQLDAESPHSMDKRWGSSHRRQKYGKYSAPAKPKKTKPTGTKSRARPSSLGSLGSAFDLLNKKFDDISQEKESEKEEAQSKAQSNSFNFNNMDKEESKEEKEEQKDKWMDSFLSKILGLGSSSQNVPPESPEEEAPPEEYQVEVKRYDPIMFLGREYNEEHADSMVGHLLEKRHIRIEEEANADELVQPEAVDHQNALHDRNSGHHAKRSGGEFDSQLRQHEFDGRHHERRSPSGHRAQKRAHHGVSSTMAEDNIARMPLSVKHKRSLSRRQAPVKRSPMMLGIKKSLTRF